MCDEGRYGWKYIHDANRNTVARVLRGADYVNVESSELAIEIGRLLPVVGSPVANSSGALAGVVSPFLTVEEAYLFCQYLRSIDPAATLVVGPIPRIGEDETFPNGFTIHAEKCPNRRGVEKVVGHFADCLVSWNEFVEGAAAMKLRAIWFTGGYPTSWNTTDVAGAFADVPLRIVQDLFASPLWDSAHIQIPAAAYPEREGSFVNYADRLQTFRWAIRPPAGITPEGRLFWQLSGRTGLYQAAAVREDLSREIGYFSPASGTIPDTGVDLRISQLAAFT